MFVSDDIAAFLEAMGDEATFGASSFKVDFHGPYETIDYRNSDIVSSEPFALADPYDIADLGLVAGDSITTMGREYLITAIEPDESGFSVLHLGKVLPLPVVEE
ncbi:MAG: head-tail joining protein [Limnohabitans sp.]